jgi:hypothetical protein
MNYGLKLADKATLTIENERAVLFSKVTGDFFGLNQTATYLVSRLLDSDYARTVAEASQAFGVPAETISADLTEIVVSLEAMKLVEKIGVAS